MRYQQTQKVNVYAAQLGNLLMTLFCERNGRRKTTSRLTHRTIPAI